MGSQAPTRTRAVFRAESATRPTNAVLPTPASPPTKARRPRPAAASASSRSRSPRNASRSSNSTSSRLWLVLPRPVRRPIRCRQDRPAAWAPQWRGRGAAAGSGPSRSGLRDIRAPEKREAEREVRRARDPDAAADHDRVAPARGWRVNAERRQPEVPAVVAHGDPERLGEPGRAAGEGAERPRGSWAGVSLPAPPGHGADSGDGLERPDEDAARGPRGARDGVETVVEAIGPKDVRDAPGPVEEPAAAGPEGRVRGTVFRSEVRLGLHDAPRGEGTPELGDDHAAEKVPGDGGGGSLVEPAREHGTRAAESRARGRAGPASAYSSPPLTSTIAPWT
jgi:hypothetical protein